MTHIPRQSGKVSTSQRVPQSISVFRVRVSNNNMEIYNAQRIKHQAWIGDVAYVVWAPTYTQSICVHVSVGHIGELCKICKTNGCAFWGKDLREGTMGAILEAHVRNTNPNPNLNPRTWP